MFSLPTTVIVSGRSYPVRTDFRVILEIFVMLEDPDLSDSDKTEALLRMFYEDRPPAEETDAAVRAFLDFLEPGGTAPRPGKKSPGLIRWQQDFPLIVAPVNKVLGTECRALPYLHWYTFLAAFLEMDGDSLFSRVLSIRDKLSRGKKLEKWERDFLRQNPDLVQPPVRLSAAETALLKGWA